MQRTSICGGHSHKWDLYHSPSQKLRDHLARGDDKIIRARLAGERGPDQNAVFWTCQNCCTRELKTVVAAYIIPKGDQASQYSNGRSSVTPMVIAELLTVASFWERESHFSLKGVTLVDQPHSQWTLPYSRASQIRLCGFFKRMRKREVMRRMRMRKTQTRRRGRRRGEDREKQRHKIGRSKVWIWEELVGGAG